VEHARVASVDVELDELLLESFEKITQRMVLNGPHFQSEDSPLFCGQAELKSIRQLLHMMPMIMSCRLQEKTGSFLKLATTNLYVIPKLHIPYIIINQHQPTVGAKSGRVSTF
jgi:hypothetical protein